MISFELEAPLVDERPTYKDWDDLDRDNNKYQRLYEDSAGQFVILPDGWYAGVSEKDFIIVNYGTEPWLRRANGRSGNTQGIVNWPIRPARKTVKITITGDA